MIGSCQDFWLDVFPGIRLQCLPRARRERASRGEQNGAARFARLRRMQNLSHWLGSGQSTPCASQSPLRVLVPSARQAVQPPAPLRCARSAARSRPSVRQAAQSPAPPLRLRCARSAARFAPKRAPSSSGACPEPKRAKSLGWPDRDPRRRWRPMRTDRTGACDLSAQRGRPYSHPTPLGQKQLKSRKPDELTAR